MTPATIQTLPRLAALVKARRNSVPSATAIVSDAARRLGIDWRTCGDRDAIRLLHEVRLVARAWLRREGERLAAVLYPDQVSKGLFGKAKEAVDRTFDRARKFIRNAIVAGWLAITGPSDVPAQIEVPIAAAPVAPTPPSGSAPPAAAAPPQPPGTTPNHAAAESLRRSIDEQLAYLDRFRREVLDGETAFQPARLEQYGASTWGAAQDAAGAAASVRRFREGRREHLGADQPCGGCAFQVKRGWVPIQTIPSIGSQACRQSCHCIIVYRDDETGDEYPLGRLPNVRHHIHRSNFRSLGVRFRKDDSAVAMKYKTVIVDVSKLNAAWAKDHGFYLAPGAEHVRGRIDEARRYLERAQREGLPFDQSRATIDPDGTVSFADGRHRFAMLRDRGIAQLPISVPASQAEEFKRRFGWGGDGRFGSGGASPSERSAKRRARHRRQGRNAPGVSARRRRVPPKTHARPSVISQHGHQDQQKLRRAQARERVEEGRAQRAERRALQQEQYAEWRELRQNQRREAARRERQQDAARRKIDAHYDEQLNRGKNLAAVQYAREDKHAAVAERHAHAQQDLHASHAHERAELGQRHATERAEQRESHRERGENMRLRHREEEAQHLQRERSQHEAEQDIRGGRVPANRVDPAFHYLLPEHMRLTQSPS